MSNEWHVDDADGFQIVPPLNNKEISQVHHLDRFSAGINYVQLDIEESVEELDEGTFTRKKSGWLECPGQAGTGVQDDLDVLARAVGKNHIFKGYFEIIDVDSDTLFRLYIVGTECIRVEPTITWNAPQEHTNGTE